MRPPLSRTEFIAVAKGSIAGWVDDRAPSMGAALAYYTVLSLAPLLLIVLSVAGLAFGREAAQGALMEQLRGLLGPQGAAAIQTVVASTKSISGGVISVIIGSMMLVLGATSVFAELQSDLDHIWKAPRPKRSGIVTFLRTRIISFGLVLAAGFLLLVSLLLEAAISAVGHLWGQVLAGQATVALVLNFAVGVAIISALFALLFKFLPNARIAWSDVWTGAFLSALLFSIGKFAIGMYIGHSAVSSSFGAAGALVVLIVWVYYAAQVFLFGAEFTYHYACLHGSHRHALAAGTDGSPPVREPGAPAPVRGPPLRS